MRNVVVPEEYRHLAEYLRQQVRDLGMQQKTIAVKTGVTESYVSQVLNGRIKPSDGFLQKLEGALELSPGRLFLRLGRPQMDFIRSFLSQRPSDFNDYNLSDITPDERSALIRYLRFLRLQTQVSALSELSSR